MFDVNLYIETSIKAPKAKKGYYICVLEYITSGGVPCTLNVMGSAEDVSRQRMELVALLAALKRLTRSSEIRVFSECEGFLAPLKNGWLDKWQQNGFETKKKEPVKNADIWKELAEHMKIHMIHEEKQSEHPYKQWMQSELAKMKEVNA